uniref:ATP-dependent RNA helicase n=1 Tax=Compsopogon caeruleus TaxID=31354 RepID=A0A7S1TB49_9RHOD
MELSSGSSSSSSSSLLNLPAEVGQNQPGRDSDFFAGVVSSRVTKRHAWELGPARNAARPLGPGQTTVEHKVGQVLHQRKAKRARLVRDAKMGGEDEGERDHHGVDAKGKDVTRSVVDGGNERRSHEDKVLEEGDEVVDVSDEGGLESHENPVEEEHHGLTFSDLMLSKPLLKAVAGLGWTTATPVQQATIPAILSGRDLCGSAVTGSGKTAAFILPILERLLQGRAFRTSQLHTSTKVVVLSPTRELAVQCQAVVVALARHTSIRCAMAVGGLGSRSQETDLRTRPEIVVATPGRLIDHLRNTKDFAVDEVEILVMDEADRLLELGFKEEVEELLRYFSSTRQTLLFSATMTPQVEWLVKLSLEKPLKVAVNPLFDVASTLTQEFVKVKGASLENNKDAVLLSLCSRSFRSKTIVFFGQKHVAHRFMLLFGLAELKAAELHGNMTQGQRLEALEQFRDEERDFLLCTDLAARGLDIVGVRTVINFDMPRTLTDYIHRVGRTARAGAAGRAISLIEEQDRKLLKQIHKRARSKLAARIIPSDSIRTWRQRIDAMTPEVQQILSVERQEKELRAAQVQLNRADHLVHHAEEIYSRPKRTWFRTASNPPEASRTRARNRDSKRGRSRR